MSGKRTGNGVGPQLREVFERVCKDAEVFVRKDQAQRRVAVTQEALDEKMDNIRGAVTMGATNLKAFICGTAGLSICLLSSFFNLLFPLCLERCFGY